MFTGTERTNFPQVPLAMSQGNVESWPMRFRLPLLRTFAMLALAMNTSTVTRAQEAAPGELKLLRLMIEQQAKQIEVLNAKIASLTAKIEDPARPVPVAKAPVPEKAEAAVPAARPVAPPVPTHTVVKGESLGKIAQIHGTTIIELQKLNRIRDPKKIQVGQQLKFPAPPPQPPAPAQPQQPAQAPQPAKQ